MSDDDARTLELSFGSTNNVMPISTKLGFCDTTDNIAGLDRTKLACLEELLPEIEQAAKKRSKELASCASSAAKRKRQKNTTPETVEPMTRVSAGNTALEQILTHCVTQSMALSVRAIFLKCKKQLRHLALPVIRDSSGRQFRSTAEARRNTYSHPEHLFVSLDSTHAPPAPRYACRRRSVQLVHLLDMQSG